MLIARERPSGTYSKHLAASRTRDRVLAKLIWCHEVLRTVSPTISVLSSTMPVVKPGEMHSVDRHYLRTIDADHTLLLVVIQIVAVLSMRLLMILPLDSRVVVRRRIR